MVRIERWPRETEEPMRVDTAPEGEDMARENWSKHGQTTRRANSTAFKAKVALAAKVSADTVTSTTPAGRTRIRGGPVCSDISPVS